EWDIHSREDALAYARNRNIDLPGVDQTKLYSRDENLWHISHEGGPLEDPTFEPEEEMFLWTNAPRPRPTAPPTWRSASSRGGPCRWMASPWVAWRSWRRSTRSARRTVWVAPTWSRTGWSG